MGMNLRPIRPCADTIGAERTARGRLNLSFLLIYRRGGAREGPADRDRGSYVGSAKSGKEARASRSRRSWTESVGGVAAAAIFPPRGFLLSDLAVMAGTGEFTKQPQPGPKVSSCPGSGVSTCGPPWLDEWHEGSSAFA